MTTLTPAPTYDLTTAQLELSNALAVAKNHLTAGEHRKLVRETVLELLKSPVDEFDELEPLWCALKVLERELEQLLGLHIKNENARHLHQLSNKRPIAQCSRALAILRDS